MAGRSGRLRLAVGPVIRIKGSVISTRLKTILDRVNPRVWDFLDGKGKPL
jgi:hypothetical protein